MSKRKTTALSQTFLLLFMIVGLSLALGGCSKPRLMMPTPNVLLTTLDNAKQNLSAPQMSPEVDLLYFTDRVSEQNSAGTLTYGSIFTA